MISLPSLFSLSVSVYKSNQHVMKMKHQLELFDNKKGKEPCRGQGACAFGRGGQVFFFFFLVVDPPSPPHKSIFSFRLPIFPLRFDSVFFLLATMATAAEASVSVPAAAGEWRLVKRKGQEANERRTMFFWFLFEQPP